jgi:hypothetical protein
MSLLPTLILAIPPTAGVIAGRAGILKISAVRQKLLAAYTANNNDQMRMR